MKNIIKKYMQNYRTEKSKFLQDLKKETEIKSILAIYYYKNLIPFSSEKKQWQSAKELKEYLIKRYELNQTKKLNTFLERLQTVQSSEDIKSINISINWNRSQTWGNNAAATIEARYKNGNFKRFEGGRTSGCGYDKESTAIASGLNQINGLLKKMYLIKNQVKNVDQANSVIFGYGAGYGLLPSFEGGVGVNCYPDIIKKLGGKWKSITHGKTFDVYTIEFK